VVKIHCRTNLDLVHTSERWPNELPEVPRVGDIIQSANVWKYHPEFDGDGGFIRFLQEGQLELAVVQVTWKWLGKDMWGNAREILEDVWSPEVELNLPPHRFENLTRFHEWYGKITGKGQSAFITFPCRVIGE
jgi:hypothetical protein